MERAALGQHFGQEGDTGVGQLVALCSPQKRCVRVGERVRAGLQTGTNAFTSMHVMHIGRKGDRDRADVVGRAGDDGSAVCPNC